MKKIFGDDDSFGRPFALSDCELSNGDDSRRGDGVHLIAHWARSGLWAAALCLAFVLGSLGWKSFSATRESAALAPDFVLPDSGGKEVRLSDYRGKVVALNFWATWCGPCKLEVPWLNRLERQHAKSGFAVVGISVDEQGWKAVKPFLAELKVSYRVLLSKERIGSRYTGADVLPSTILIDRTGRIAASYLGVVKRSDFEQRLEGLLRSSK